MKKYKTPILELSSKNEQDIVCESRGMLVGDGANDIGNWYWTLPSATSNGVVEMAQDRSI